MKKFLIFSVVSAGLCANLILAHHCLWFAVKRGPQNPPKTAAMVPGHRVTSVKWDNKRHCYYTSDSSIVHRTSRLIILSCDSLSKLPSDPSSTQSCRCWMLAMCLNPVSGLNRLINVSLHSMSESLGALSEDEPRRLQSSVCEFGWLWSLWLMSIIIAVSKLMTNDFKFGIVAERSE